MSKQLYMVDLDDLAIKQRKECEQTVGRVVQRTIVFFDLKGSTPLKLGFGHMLGTRTALTHNKIAKVVVERYGGLAIKNLGDGILVEFENPLSACLAMLNVKQALEVQNILSKVGATIGAIEEISIDGQRDILGTTVDRCARIVDTALSSQILIDRPLRDAVLSFLRDYDDIVIGSPFHINLKDIGDTELFELSTDTKGLVGSGVDQSLDPISQLVQAETGFSQRFQSRWILSSRLYQQPEPIITERTRKLDILVSGGKSLFHDRAFCDYLKNCALNNVSKTLFQGRVLFVNHSSTAVKTRAKYVGEDPRNYARYIRDCVAQSVSHIQKIKDAGVQLEWRYYSESPIAFRFIIVDYRLFLSYYMKGQRETSEVLEYRRLSASTSQATIFNAFANLFELVWDQAKLEL